MYVYIDAHSPIDTTHIHTHTYAHNCPCLYIKVVSINNPLHVCTYNGPQFYTGSTFLCRLTKSTRLIMFVYPAISALYV